MDIANYLYEVHKKNLIKLDQLQRPQERESTKF